MPVLKVDDSVLGLRDFMKRPSWSAVSSKAKGYSKQEAPFSPQH